MMVRDIHVVVRILSLLSAASAVPPEARSDASAGSFARTTHHNSSHVTLIQGRWIGALGTQHGDHLSSSSAQMNFAQDAESWALNMALNAAYAARHGHNYVFYDYQGPSNEAACSCPDWCRSHGRSSEATGDTPGKLLSNWCKVKAIIVSARLLSFSTSRENGFSHPYLSALAIFASLFLIQGHHGEGAFVGLLSLPRHRRRVRDVVDAAPLAERRERPTAARRRGVDAAAACRRFEEAGGTRMSITATAALQQRFDSPRGRRRDGRAADDVCMNTHWGCKASAGSLIFHRSVKTDRFCGTGGTGRDAFRAALRSGRRSATHRLCASLMFLRRLGYSLFSYFP